MKVRLVTHVDESEIDKVTKLAGKETRTVSSMAAILIREALAAREKRSK